MTHGGYNQREAAEAFAFGQHFTSGNMKSVGDRVYSYDEMIAERLRVDGVTVISINPEKFSVTTSRHQNAVRKVVESLGFRFTHHDKRGWEIYQYQWEGS